MRSVNKIIIETGTNQSDKNFSVQEDNKFILNFLHLSLFLFLEIALSNICKDFNKKTKHSVRHYVTSFERFSN